MDKDDLEIIELFCDKCKQSVSGTYKELFGDLPSLRLLPRMICKCSGDICVNLTGKYKEAVNDR